jgi:hypothetical protein
MYFPWLSVEAALSIFYLILFLLKIIYGKELRKTKETAIKTEP